MHASFLAWVPSVPGLGVGEVKHRHLAPVPLPEVRVVPPDALLRVEREGQRLPRPLRPARQGL